MAENAPGRNAHDVGSTDQVAEMTRGEACRAATTAYKCGRRGGVESRNEAVASESAARDEGGDGPIAGFESDSR
jgi:hypothetical protein